MTTTTTLLQQLYGKTVIIQQNDGSQSFLHTDSSNTIQSTPQLGADILNLDTYHFEVLNDGTPNEFGLRHIHNNGHKRLGVNDKGQLVLGVPLSAFSSFKLQDTDQPLARIPHTFLPALDTPTHKGKFRAANNEDTIISLTLRLVTFDKLPSQVQSPDQYLSYAVHQLSSLDKEEELEYTSKDIPDPLNPAVSMVSAISMNPGAQSEWAKDVKKEMIESEGWLNQCPKDGEIPMSVARLLLLCATLVYYRDLQLRVLLKGDLKTLVAAAKAKLEEFKNLLTGKGDEHGTFKVELEKLKNQTEEAHKLINSVVKQCDIQYETLCDFFSPLDNTTASAFSGAFYRGGAKPFIIIAMKGTTDLREWLANLQTAHILPSNDSNIQGSVHQGFYNCIFKKQRFEFQGGGSQSVLPIDMLVERIEEIVQRLREDGLAPQVIVPIFVTGHSLGGALATVVHRALQGRPLPVNVLLAHLTTFGSPRVGDKLFAQSFDGTILNDRPIPQHSYRIVNDNDIVSKVPATDPKDQNKVYYHIDTGLKAVPGQKMTTISSEIANAPPKPLDTDDRLKKVLQAFYRDGSGEHKKPGFEDIAAHLPSEYWKALATPQH